MGNKVLARECKFIFHLPMIDEYRDDTHVIKETLHMEDGSLVSNLRILNNFERPFYVTKPIKQIYKQKKESELIDNLNMYKATDSALGVAAATRLGREFIGKKTLYDVSKSPYLYGTDVSAATIIKNTYMTKYPDAISEYKLCVIDIEADVDTGEMVIVSVCTRENIYTAILSKIVKNKKTFQDDINYLYKKHIPDTEISRAIKPVFELFDNEITMLKAVMAKAHTWKPDFMVVWNIEYEIPFFMKLCEANSVRPEDIFSDPDLPRNLKYFNYKQGQKSKKTASGVFKPMNPEEQWHVVHCPAHFYWIDAMSAHRYVRAGGKSVSGGYSLDNILNKELGEKFMKLKFTDDPNIEGKKGIDWHKYMLHNKPLEYIIYNNWDTMSILHLDDHTKDLCNVLPMLSGVSSFDIFNSGPKRIADAMYFFYKENGKILGTKGKSLSDEYVKKEDRIEDTVLGLDNWIVLLPSHRIKNNGLRIIEESPEIPTNARGFIFDSDQVSGYPSDTQAGNVSKDTTVREIIDINGIDKDDFKLQNINLMFGIVNNVEYCSTMFNFPTLVELKEKIKNKNIS